MGFVWLCCGWKPRGVKLGVHYIAFHTNSLQTDTNPTTNCYWLHYKLLLTSLQTISDFITSHYWLVSNFITNYKLLVTFFKFRYKLLLTWLQTISDFFKFHYKLLLTWLQTITDLITNYYWLVSNFITYKLLLTSLQIISDLFQISWQIVTDFITNYYWLVSNFITNCYWLHYKPLLTTLQGVHNICKQCTKLVLHMLFRASGWTHSLSKNGDLVGWVL